MDAVHIACELILRYTLIPWKGGVSGERACARLLCSANCKAFETVRDCERKWGGE